MKVRRSPYTTSCVTLLPIGEARLQDRVGPKARLRQIGSMRSRFVPPDAARPRRMLLRSVADSSPHDYSARTATPSVVPTGGANSHPTRGWSGPVTRLVLMTRRSQTETAPLLVCSVLPNSVECCIPCTNAPTLTVTAVK